MKKKEICTWTDEGDFYSTDCGNEFTLTTDDIPEEHDMKFCCFCGKKLKSVTPA